MDLQKQKESLETQVQDFEKKLKEGNLASDLNGACKNSKCAKLEQQVSEKNKNLYDLNVRVGCLQSENTEIKDEI